MLDYSFCILGVGTMEKRKLKWVTMKQKPILILQVLESL